VRLSGLSFSVLQSIAECVAACCRVLQDVAAYCSVLQDDRQEHLGAALRYVIQCVAEHCRMCCSVLQGVAGCCSVLQRVAG